MLIFLYPTYFIVKILVGSFISAYLLCKLDNKPFFNPELYSHEYVINKIKIISLVGKNVIILYNIIYYLLVQYNINNIIVDMQTRIFTNIKFIFILEFIAYVYHYLSHNISYIYKNSHYIHHKNKKIYPIDFLEFDIIDNIAQTLYINLPLYLINMNINDYGIIYYVYATGAFLIHSDILNNDHIIHHKYYKYNYGLLLPFFDMLFGTYMNYESKKKYIEIIE